MTSESMKKSGDLQERLEQTLKERDKYREQVKALKAQLRSSRDDRDRALDMFESMVETTGDGIMIEDENGLVSYANRGLVSMLGWDSAEDVLHKPWVEFFSIEKDRKVKGMKGVYESQLLTRNKQKVPVLVSSTSFYFRDRYVGVLSFIKDISERRQAEESLARSEKLAAIAQLTMGISHEIKNPLSVMQAHVDLLTDKREIRQLENQKINYSLEVIAEQTRRITATITSLSALSRDTPSKQIRLDASALIRDVTDMFSPRLEKSAIELKREWDDSAEIWVVADRGQCFQLLTNLMFNAIESMDPGGVLTVALARDTQTRRAHFSVSDTGSGIDSETMKRIFAPFFTTKQQGTGMGLAICQRIAEEHGGALAVFSAPEKGTTVTLKLPLAPELENPI